jgi:spore coat protein U-like protein
MSRHIIAPIAAGVLLAMAGAAQAATKTASFNVTASVAKNCIISATALSFGAFDGTNDLANTSSIAVRCTNGTAYDLNLSTGGSGNYPNRRMTDGTDNLFYNLYTDGTYATVWGDGVTASSGNVDGTGTGMGSAQEVTYTVHGRLRAVDNTGPIGAGNYSDTIVATVVY